MNSVVILVAVGVLGAASGLPVENDFGSMIFMPGEIPIMFDVGSSGRSSANPPANTRRISVPEENDSTSSESIINGVKCGTKYGTAVYRGTCQRLLTQALCLQDEWLVKRRDSNEAECKAKNCPEGQLYFEEKCVSVNDKTVCSRGQMLYVDMTGQVHCDCEPNYFYDPWKGHCFTQHERGSCNFGQYLEVTNSGQVKCVPNPCHVDGYFLNEEDGRCYKKDYTGICPDTFSVKFSRENLTVHCIPTSPHTIFDLPTLRTCSPGSLRDFAGACREDFRVAVENVYPSTFGQCLKGFVKDPMGKCRKANKLFR